jgi:hypothetical protein
VWVVLQAETDPVSGAAFDVASLLLPGLFPGPTKQGDRGGILLRHSVQGNVRARFR